LLSREDPVFGNGFFFRSNDEAADIGEDIDAAVVGVAAGTLAAADAGGCRALFNGEGLDAPRCDTFALRGIKDEDEVEFELTEK
jgi:hypothetical protein